MQRFATKCNVFSVFGWPKSPKTFQNVKNAASVAASMAWAQAEI
jgi:hypothetical protein